ncbi:MAG: shikimate kinase [Phycisphaerales bacterium JB038]
MHIILIGLRGSGKSTVGEKLADELWRDFVDLDLAALEKFAEPTITEIFDKHGEAAWREAEVEALRETLARDSLVLSLGGGTAMIPAARDLLEERQRGHGDRVIYLRARAETLQQRLAHDMGDRPSLTGMGTVAEVGAVLAERDPVYRDLADQTIEVDEIDLSAILGHIFRVVG